MRRCFAGFLAAIVILSAQSQENPLPSPNLPPPNVIIILTDDQGYRDLGCFGSPNIATPHIDRLASEGMKFTNFYSASPVCSTSRAALLTGCYPARVGVPNVLWPNSKTGLNPNEDTIADILKSRNYTTACVGKWHVGDSLPTLPKAQGFDSYFGIPYSNDMTLGNPLKTRRDDAEELDEIWRDKRWKVFRTELYRDNEVVEFPVNQITLSQRYTDECLKFIDHNSDRPFFLYMAHAMPHVPLFVAESRYEANPAKAYQLAVEHIDDCVGQILDKLDSRQLAHNTLVIFTSDNGPWLKKGWHGGCSIPLRDGKRTTYEGGMKIPCVMRWPARIKPGQTCDRVTSTIDLLPTLAAISEAKLSSRKIDGHNMLPLFDDPTHPSPYDEKGFFYYNNDKIQGIRKGDWKMRLETASKPELFNLRDDISESQNMIRKHPEIAKDLKARMIAFDAELKANSRPPWRAREKMQ